MEVLTGGLGSPTIRPMPTSAPRILFISSSRIGDAVLSTAVLAYLVDTYPQARFTVACGPLVAPLFADLPNLDRVWIIKKRRRGGHWWDLWKAMAGTRWDVVADTRGSLVAWVLRAGRRLAFRAQKRHEHRVEELARQMRLPPLSPRLWVSPERDAKVAALLGDGPILAVGPTANWGGKQWPADRFAETVRRLVADDGILPQARVAVFGAPSERDMALPVLSALASDRMIDLVGTPDLLDAFAMLRRCSFYLGNDSGLMHMAAAAGIPTLGLFGPSPEWRYGPRGARAAAVRTPESFDELVTNNPAFDHRSHQSLMTTLTVDNVVAAARTLWAS